MISTRCDFRRNPSCLYPNKYPINEIWFGGPLYDFKNFTLPEEIFGSDDPASELCYWHEICPLYYECNSVWRDFHWPCNDKDRQFCIAFRNSFLDANPSLSIRDLCTDRAPMCDVEPDVLKCLQKLPVVNYPWDPAYATPMLAMAHLTYVPLRHVARHPRYQKVSQEQITNTVRPFEPFEQLPDLLRIVHSRSHYAMDKYREEILCFPLPHMTSEETQERHRYLSDLYEAASTHLYDNPRWRAWASQFPRELAWRKPSSAFPARLLSPSIPAQYRVTLRYHKCETQKEKVTNKTTNPEDSITSNNHLYYLDGAKRWYEKPQPSKKYVMYAGEPFGPIFCDFLQSISGDADVGPDIDPNKPDDYLYLLSTPDDDIGLAREALSTLRTFGYELRWPLLGPQDNPLNRTLPRVQGGPKCPYPPNQHDGGPPVTPFSTRITSIDAPDTIIRRGTSPAIPHEFTVIVIKRIEADVIALMFTHCPMRILDVKSLTGSTSESDPAQQIATQL